MLTGGTSQHQLDFKSERNVQQTSFCTPVVTSSEVHEDITSKCSSLEEARAPTLSTDAQACHLTHPSLPSTSNCPPGTTSPQKTGVSITTNASTSLPISQTVSTTIHASAHSVNEVFSSSACLLPTSVILSPASVSVTNSFHNHPPLFDSSLANVSVAQPHNIIVLSSQEGSESPFSLTPPLDISDVDEGSKQQGSSGGVGDNFDSGVEALPLRDTNIDSELCVSSCSENSQAHPKYHQQSTVGLPSGDVQIYSEGLGEAAMSSGQEYLVAGRMIGAEGVGNRASVFQEVGESDESKKSSTSDVPLPLDTPSQHLPPKVSDTAATNNATMDRDVTSLNDSEADAQDTLSGCEGESAEAMIQFQPQNGKDGK